MKRRTITVTEGTNKVIGIETEKIIYEINNTIQSKLSKGTEIKFWDGKTSERIYKELYERFKYDLGIIGLGYVGLPWQLFG